MYGSLCSELDKQDDGLDRAAAVLMSRHVEWASEQFSLMGRKDADDLALQLVATTQGASLLANTLRDPDVLTGARAVASQLAHSQCISRPQPIVPA